MQCSSEARGATSGDHWSRRWTPQLWAARPRHPSYFQREFRPHPSHSGQQGLARNPVAGGSAQPKCTLRATMLSSKIYHSNATSVVFQIACWTFSSKKSSAFLFLVLFVGLWLSYLSMVFLTVTIDFSYLWSDQHYTTVHLLRNILDPFSPYIFFSNKQVHFNLVINWTNLCAHHSVGNTFLLPAVLRKYGGIVALGVLVCISLDILFKLFLNCFYSY